MTTSSLPRTGNRNGRLRLHGSRPFPGLAHRWPGSSTYRCRRSWSRSAAVTRQRRAVLRRTRAGSRQQRRRNVPRDVAGPGPVRFGPARPPVLVQLARFRPPVGSPVGRADLARAVTLLQVATRGLGLPPIVAGVPVRRYCRTKVATIWMWSGPCRTATHRTARVSPCRARPVRAITSPAMCAHCSSVSHRSEGAARTEQCHTV